MWFLLGDFLQTLPVEAVSCIELFVGCIFMLLLTYFWEFSGICVYIALATIVANIEVLKGVKFALSNNPIALGNVVFGTVSIAIAVATEKYGSKQAKSCVWLGFFAIMMFAVFMLFAVGYKPLKPLTGDMSYLAFNHYYIKKLFTPSIGVAIASLIAFLVSGRVEVFLLSAMKSLFRSTAKSDIVRMLIASNVAICVDLFLMNYMAWMLFVNHDIGFRSLFSTYIFSSYIFRALTSLATYPMVSIAKVCHRRNS